MGQATTVTLIVLGVIVGDVVIAAIIGKAIVASMWNPLAKKHDAVEPETDAVRKNFQSFRIGAANLGFCVHVAADEHRLHLLPARFLRWFGAKPICVPWDQITIKKRGKRYSSVKIGRQSVYGPAWCLNLADPADEKPPKN